MPKFYEGPKGGKITFPDDYGSTFEQFKDQFEETHPFRKLEKKQRLVELKKAFDIAKGDKK